MIAGYFGIYTEKFSVKKIVEAVPFYTIAGTVCFYFLLHFNVISAPLIVGDFIFYMAPIGDSVYWFASVYVILMLMKNTVNQLLVHSSMKKIVLAIIAMQCLHTILRYHVGYYLGLLIGVLFYTIGAFMRMYESQLKKIKNVYWILLFLTGWAGYIIFSNMGMVITTISICVMSTISAVGVTGYMIFGKEFYSSRINSIAASTFGIYLAHEHPLFRKIIWNDILHVAEIQYQSKLFLLYLVVSVLGIFMFGLLVEQLRKK